MTFALIISTLGWGRGGFPGANGAALAKPQPEAGTCSIEHIPGFTEGTLLSLHTSGLQGFACPPTICHHRDSLTKISVYSVPEQTLALSNLKVSVVLHSASPCLVRGSGQPQLACLHPSLPSPSAHWLRATVASHVM